MLKLKFLLLLIFVSFIAILGKLLYIQTLYVKTHPTDYLTIRSLEPERGRIFDRNGSPMVVNQSSYNLFVEPKHVVDRDKLIEKLDEVLHMGEATLESRIDPKLS